MDFQPYRYRNRPSKTLLPYLTEEDIKKMGAETSRELFTAEIPTSLRCIYPFLSDAQKNIQHAQKAASLQSSFSFKRIGVACINHGFKLLNVLNTDLDHDASSCLETFRLVRVKLCHDLGLPSSGLPDYHGPSKSHVYQSHEIIIAEADEVLALAEEQYNEGFKFDAMLNYHSACIYYRVMESMIPSVISSVHQKLLYASWRSIKLSELSSNYVSEYFDGVSCADHYEIHGTNKLGKGSYGSVYLATHRITGDESAVKVMNVDKVTSYYLRKLHTEISILKEIDHPNIIKLKDVYFGKRSVYLVTDLCRGGELLELLNSGKSQGFVFREDRASKLMRDMISAVHYLHSKGIVHRDLKLENFLFETKSASSPLVLIDFGLSKHVEKSERLSQRVGSCYYIAPEVLSGGYDYRCDIWSLGVLCYMLLSGSPPFFGKTVEDVYEATLKQEPVFPDKKFRHISAKCMDFMRRLLVKDPSLRMSTEAALAHPFISNNSLPQYSGASSISGIGSLLSNVTTLNPLEVAMGISAYGIVEPFDKNQADEIIASLSTFILAHPLCKLVYQLIANSFSRDDVLKFRNEFLFIDKTNYGVILLKDFQNAFVQGTLVETEAVSMSNIFNIIAIERSHGHCDGLNYTEYVAAAMLGRVNIDYNRILVVFHKLDYNDEGFINSAKLRKVLGEDMNENVLTSMMRIDNSDTDGNVSLDQFISLINTSLGKNIHREESKDDFKESKDEFKDSRMDVSV